MNHTFVYVTHDQSEAANIADRVAVLHNGVIEQIGTYEEIYNKPETTWVGDFIGTYPMNFIDGSIYDYKDKKIGFRPSWVDESLNDFELEISLIEKIENNYFIHCNLGEKNIVIRSNKNYNIGEKIKVGLSKFNVYKDEKLESVIENKKEKASAD